MNTSQRDNNISPRLQLPATTLTTALTAITPAGQNVWVEWISVTVTAVTDTAVTIKDGRGKVLVSAYSFPTGVQTPIPLPANGEGAYFAKGMLASAGANTAVDIFVVARLAQ